VSYEWTPPKPLPSLNNNCKEDYNLKLLPKALKLAAEEVARFAKVPVASPAIVGLSCIATAIGKKAVVVEREGLEHHPAMFFALIAASGERKSPAFTNMTHPFNQWSKLQNEQHQEQLIEVKSNNEMVDCAIAALKYKAKKADADHDHLKQDLIGYEQKRKSYPPSPSLYTTDTTEERLFQKMHERNEAFAVLSGEGRGAMDQILGKYTSGNGTGDALYLAGITGDTVTRDRMGTGGIPEERVMYKPCLNVCIMIQPDKYLEIARHPSLRDAGTLARIWPVWLPSLVGKRIEEEHEEGLDISIMDNYNTLINNLLEINSPDSEKDGCLHKSSLSKKAAEARRLFHNKIERMMAEGQKFDDVRDIASKAVTQTAKMALLLHLAEQPGLLVRTESVIDLETWLKAEELGKYHLIEAVRIQRLSAEDELMSRAKRILKWIKSHCYKELTLTQVYQYGPTPRPSAKEAREVLQILIDYDYLQLRRNKYIANPLLWV